MEGDEFTMRVLDLLLLSHQRPEARFGHNGIGGKDSHAVNLGLSLLLGGLSSSYNQVLLDGLHGNLGFSVLYHASYFCH